MSSELKEGSVEDPKRLENRLKKATNEESRQLLKEFVDAFCADPYEAASPDGVTLDGHSTE